ncbi:hypothetical protein GZ77_14795 [Endozoicomonas montiporae]|uniref:Cytochrome c-type biogenesis protein n=2 Tax=Endozoicomonas montiporae TaxID=1027273 RepID=A0A081N563_9GAMM|nr:cytochrome c-type biogenesis protein [Endozoicomonas montiporae]AMO57534.1 cytochrome c-type biogenesis protein CcmH [Endozoicomonas montiporae CL-33]KEQ13586.1 hypothetical protein GZ77_14795 [Endozoicomonas montiporae]
MQRLVQPIICLLSFCLVMTAGAAVVEDYVFTNPEEQNRFIQLTTELRCPQCQNQSIADSNAGISEDLRREVYRMINEDMDDQAIIQFMQARYGDFVLYKPRLNAETFLLWFGPLLLLILALGILGLLLRKHRKTHQPGVLSTAEQVELDKIMDGKQ